MVHIVYNNRGGCIRFCNTSNIPARHPAPHYHPHPAPHPHPHPPGPTPHPHPHPAPHSHPHPTPKPTPSNVCSSTYCQAPYKGQCRATTGGMCWDYISKEDCKKSGDYADEPDYVWCGD